MVSLKEKGTQSRRASVLKFYRLLVGLLKTKLLNTEAQRHGGCTERFLGGIYVAMSKVQLASPLPFKGRARVGMGFC
jgi:hypothetical protein